MAYGKDSIESVKDLGMNSIRTIRSNDMAYEARHMKPQVKAILIEAMGPGCPQLMVDEFTSVEAARKELRRRYGDMFRRNKDFLERWGDNAYIETDHALLDADDDKFEWQVYEIHA